LAELADHRAYLAAELAAAQAAPLSRRKALLAAMLIDAYVDRLFAAGARGGDDVLEHRSRVALSFPALGSIMALCGHKGDVTLLTEAVVVPIDRYGELDVADFMVSLYNSHSVQRMIVITKDGERKDLHSLLAAAAASLDTIAVGPLLI
jgi:hypothetical protein